MPKIRIWQQVPSHLYPIIQLHPVYSPIYKVLIQNKSCTIASEDKRNPKIWCAFYDSNRELVSLGFPCESHSKNGIQIYRIKFPKVVKIKYIRPLARCTGEIKQRLEESAQPSSQIEKKLSVIISTRNRAPLLAVTLKSLQRQDLEVSKFQVVIIDDDSDDNTYSIVEQFSSDINISYYKNTKRLGKNQSRNIGITRANNEVVYLLDSDTYLSPQTLRAHYKLQNKTPSMVIGCRYHMNIRDFYDLKERDDIDSIEHFPVIPSKRTGRTSDRRFEWAEITNSYQWETFPWVNFISNNCSVPTELAAKTGFDEKMLDWGYDDIDFGFRAWETSNHIRAVFCPNAVGFHGEHKRNIVFEKKSEKHNRKLFTEHIKEIAVKYKECQLLKSTY